MFSVRYSINIEMEKMNDNELNELMSKLEKNEFKIDYYDDEFIDITEEDETNEASINNLKNFLEKLKAEFSKIKEIKLNIWYLDEADEVITI